MTTDSGTPWQDEETLRRLYHEAGLSTRDIAARLGCHHETVRKWMTRHGIERRNLKEKPLKERFWEKVNRGMTDECWEWTGCSTQRGYGHIKVDGEQRRAHRISYRLEAEDPGDNWVLHHCDNPSCVNPEHLYLGDPADNLQDAWDRKRRSAAGEANPNATLSASDVEDIRELLQKGETQTSIARDYGVASSTISEIATGKRWSR